MIKNNQSKQSELPSPPSERRVSECGRRRCRRAASETQPEPVSIQRRCHGPQHAVSLSSAAAAAALPVIETLTSSDRVFI